MEYTAAAAVRVAALGRHRARSLAARTPAGATATASARLHGASSSRPRRGSAATPSPSRGHDGAAGRRRRRVPSATKHVQGRVAGDEVGVAEGRRRVWVHLQERPLVVGQARRRVRVLAPPFLWTPRCFVWAQHNGYVAVAQGQRLLIDN